MTIRLRIALLTALVIAAIAGVSAGLSVRYMNAGIAVMVDRRVAAEAGRVADSARPYLVSGDWDGLHRVADAAARTVDVAHAAVTDNRGMVLVGSAHKLEGKALPQARKAAAARAPLVGPITKTTTAAYPILNLAGKSIGAAVVTVRTDFAEQVLRNIQNTAIAASVGVSAMGLLLAYVLAGYLVAPLAALLPAIRRMTAGDLDSRIEPPANVPEFQEIGRAFNDMASAITRRLCGLELLNLMSAEVSMAKRMLAVVRAVGHAGAAVLDADVCLWVYDPAGTRLRMAPATRAGERITAEPDSPVAWAARERSTIIIGEGGDLPSGSRVCARCPPVAAAVIVPLTTPDLVVGALSAEVPSGGRSLSYEEISLAIAMANIVGPAVGTLQRSASQARSARMLQRILVPPLPPPIPRLDVVARYLPAEEIGRMGGDYYDFIHVYDRVWCFAVGDVSGKGHPASQYTAMAKYVLRSFVLEYRSPRRALLRTNAALFAQMGGERYITIFCGILNTETLELRYARAGHPPPLLHSVQTGQVRHLQTFGLPIGIFDDARFDEGEENLQNGDVLLIYTDGLSEAHSDTEMFGDAQIEESLKLYAHLPASGIADAVIEDAKTFSGGRLRDDVAVVVVKVTGD